MCNILCKRERIKQVGTFKYLGFTITPDARRDTEIQKRTALYNDKFTKVKSIFTNRNIRIYTKINIMKAHIRSILLYGYEGWTLTKDQERRLETAEIWHIRRMMRISWTEKKSNGKVMKMAGYKRSPLKTIRKRKVQFFGHIKRADGLEKQSIEWKDLWVQKQRKTTQKIYRQTGKRRNKKRISQQLAHQEN